jgi:hypothetical protein
MVDVFERTSEGPRKVVYGHKTHERQSVLFDLLCIRAARSVQARGKT